MHYKYDSTFFLLSSKDVGNRAAVFPLQLLGFDVDVVNSVHFSNHTGYPNGFTGDVLKGDQLRQILSGLSQNDLLDPIGFVLTGYIGSESFLQAILDVIRALRKNGRSSVRYVCDPVLGDVGPGFYVPKELVALYKQKVIPLADVLTPNEFEVRQLTGVHIQNLDDAKRACRILHEMGPDLVFITSLTLPGSSTMCILASQKDAATTTTSPTDSDTTTYTTWKIECPILPGQYTGTGDLCAALLLAHTSEHPLETAMENVINTMYAVLEATQAVAGSSVRSRELKLIQSKSVIEHPPPRFCAEKI